MRLIERTWTDCRQTGRDHALYLAQTTETGNFYACNHCPVVFRKHVDRTLHDPQDQAEDEAWDRYAEWVALGRPEGRYPA